MKKQSSIYDFINSKKNNSSADNDMTKEKFLNNNLKS